jgi:heptosyltransferase-1
LAEDGLKSLINFGSGEEDLARAVEAASGSAAEMFTGSLTRLIAMTRRARLFIGGDTGPMHLSAALGVPVVGIFGPTNPARNGPFGTRNIVLRSSSSATSYKHVAELDSGLLDISSEQVVAASRRLLKERHG